MAERCGPDFRAVLLQPFALTLYAFQQLRDRDRIAALRQRERDVYRGMLTAMAMNDPKKLDGERDDVRADMRVSVASASARSQAEQLRAAGLELAARIERDGAHLSPPAAS